MEENAQELRDRVQAFVHAQLPDAQAVEVGDLRRVPSGLSRENWMFDASWTAQGQREHHALVMRRDPVGSVLETDRRREFEALFALRDSPVPCPRVFWLDASGEFLGRPAIVMQHYDGLNDHFVLEGGLSKLSLDARVRLARSFCDSLVALHAFDWKASGLATRFDSPGLAGAQAAVAEWKAYLERQQPEPVPELVEVLCWLEANAPTAQDTVLVHGDFKPGNVLLDGDRLQVVLDWETVHLGDPMEDLGWVTNPLRAREHLIPGTWEREDLLAHYAESSGRRVDPEHIHFWNVFANFKLNAILLTGVRSFREGRADRPWVDDGMLSRVLFQMIGA